MCGIFFLHKKNLSVADIGKVLKYFDRIKHRGPDNTKTHTTNDCFFGFHRLSIMDTTDKGNQPFSQDGYVVICNGEIYNYKTLLSVCFDSRDRPVLTSGSDCEILIPLFKKFGVSMVSLLDGEFVFVLRTPEGHIFAARDPVGIRPMFLGTGVATSTGADTAEILASEHKAIPPTYDVIPFPPGTYSYGNSITNFIFYSKTPLASWNLKLSNTIPEMQSIIKTLFSNAVRSYLASSRPVGVLLSGGLDSSLIAAKAISIVREYNERPSQAVREYNERPSQAVHEYRESPTTRPSSPLPSTLTAFSVGLKDSNSPDITYAKKVAEYLNINHRIIQYSFQEGVDAIPLVIYYFETYDTTTVRAGVPMYLGGRDIKENTDIRVVLSGEGSDEMFGGYIYTEKAPTYKDFQNDRERLMEELHYTDVLRADRAMASNGLELRTPFLQSDLRQYVMSIPPQYIMKAQKEPMGKMLLRNAFAAPSGVAGYSAPSGVAGYSAPEGVPPILPHEVLYRPKEAFSDGVSHSWISRLTEYFNKTISDEEFALSSKIFSPPYPLTKEAYFYRKTFEKYYPGRASLIPGYWMPKWTQVKDPSATLLDNYQADTSSV